PSPRTWPDTLGRITDAATSQGAQRHAAIPAERRAANYLPSKCGCGSGIQPWRSCMRQHAWRGGHARLRTLFEKYALPGVPLPADCTKKGDQLKWLQPL